MSSSEIESDFFKMEKQAKNIESQMEELHKNFERTIQDQIERIKDLESKLETQRSENFTLIGENLKLKFHCNSLEEEMEDRKKTCHILIGRAFKARLENESLKKEMSRMRLKMGKKRK